MDITVMGVCRRSMEGERFLAYLDSPRSGELGEMVSVRGWVLPRQSELSAMEVRATTSDGCVFSAKLDRPRETVIEKLLQADPSDHPQLHCGFQLSTPVVEGSLRVSVYEAGEELCSWNFVVGRTESAVGGQWSSFRNGVDVEPATAQDAAEGVSFLGQRVVSIEDFAATADIALAPFLDVVTALEFGLGASRSLAKLGVFFLKSPFSAGMLQPTHSFLAEHVHVVRMADASGGVVYLLQVRTSCDGLYFPQSNTFVTMRYCSALEVNAFMRFVVMNVHRLNNAFRMPGGFGGLLASTDRPSHFFSNIAPTVRYVLEEGAVPNLLYVKGGDFAPLGKALSVDVVEQTFSTDELNERLLEDGAFAFLAGVGFSWLQEASARMFDERYANYVDGAAGYRAQNVITELMAGFPVLWVGVTGQKREWREQIEGCALVIERLSARFPSLSVVYDGWTSPISVSSRDSTEAANDEAIATAIRETLARRGVSVRTRSVIGFHAVEKTAVARKVDLFLANHGTGSIHVARFARKPGVSHLSRRFMETHGVEAIHYRTRTIPVQHITDLPNDRPDMTSYRIPPEAVWSEVEVLLDSLTTGDLRNNR